ncbi:MAG: magnesium chelatase domain-containing protein [Coraliomargaritaceae bacterium]
MKSTAGKEANRYILVGLPDSAVKESQDRVLSALDNCGFQAPNTKTTINLAPGDLKKEGPSYDLPIALCLLAATQQITSDAKHALKQYLIASELSLSGSIRPIKGGLALAQLAKRLNLKGILLPEATAQEANLIEGIDVYPIQNLNQAVQFFQEDQSILPLNKASSNKHIAHSESHTDLDFSDVKGQRTY